MNALQEKTDRLLEEPWLERDVSTIRTRAQRVRARQRRTVALAALAFVVVVGAGVLAAGRLDRDAPSTLDVADLPLVQPAPHDANVTVFLEPTLTADEVAQVRAELVANPDVVQAWYRSQDVVYEEVSCLYASEPQNLESVTPSMLPASFDVVVDEGVDHEVADGFVAQMRARAGVEEVAVKPTPEEIIRSGTSLWWRPLLRDTTCTETAVAGEPIK